MTEDTVELQLTQRKVLMGNWV